jgi:hypothetical protein
MNNGNPTALQRLGERTRRRLVWSLWFVTWVGLMAGGLHNHRYYQAVVVFSILHALLFLGLTRFRVAAFPNQFRLTYLLMIVVGTYVPGAGVLNWMVTAGLASNLFLGYCPLIRLLYLMPWNRDEKLTWSLVWRVITTPPIRGRRFTPRPESPPRSAHPTTTALSSPPR